ncbi:unnamed protein product, partial [Didymodactylos carnosus]
PISNTLENVNRRTDSDSFIHYLFANNDPQSALKTRHKPLGQKKKKDESHKIEELQTNNEELKKITKLLIDDLERLTQENELLKTKGNTDVIFETSSQSCELINSALNEEQ